MKSTEREDGVVSKFKELLKIAGTDLIVLNNLERRYQSVKLEKAREEDPWELITNPILSSKPIEPKILKLALSRMLSGIFIAILLVLILDKIKGKVYEFDKLDRFFNSKSILIYLLKTNMNLTKLLH